MIDYSKLDLEKLEDKFDSLSKVNNIYDQFLEAIDSYYKDCGVDLTKSSKKEPEILELVNSIDCISYFLEDEIDKLGYCKNQKESAEEIRQIEENPGRYRRNDDNYHGLTDAERNRGSKF